MRGSTTSVRWRRGCAALVGAVAVALSVVASRHPEPEPVDLAAEVSRIRSVEFHRGDRQVAVFTGSSSIRLWPRLGEAFPGVQTVNTGFGGSTMGSLLMYRRDLITHFRPDQILIHEGDNDIALGVPTDEIIRDTRTLVRLTRQDLPDTQIVLISAKPSLARWRYHDSFRELNAKYARLAVRRPHVSYVDVWGGMLDATGRPRAELFTADGLHMNSAGYDVWRRALRPYVAGD